MSKYTADNINDDDVREILATAEGNLKYGIHITKEIAAICMRALRHDAHRTSARARVAEMLNDRAEILNARAAEVVS